MVAFYDDNSDLPPTDSGVSVLPDDANPEDYARPYDETSPGLRPPDADLSGYGGDYGISHKLATGGGAKNGSDINSADIGPPSPQTGSINGEQVLGPPPQLATPSKPAQPGMGDVHAAEAGIKPKDEPKYDPNAPTGMIGKTPVSLADLQRPAYGISNPTRAPLSDERQWLLDTAKERATKQQDTRQQALMSARQQQQKLSEAQATLADERKSLPKGLDLWSVRQAAADPYGEADAIEAKIQTGTHSVTRSERMKLLAIRTAQRTLKHVNTVDATLADFPRLQAQARQQIGSINNEPAESPEQAEAGMRGRFQRQDQQQADIKARRDATDKNTAEAADIKRAKDQYGRIKDQVAQIEKTIKPLNNEKSPERIDIESQADKEANDTGLKKDKKGMYLPGNEAKRDAIRDRILKAAIDEAGGAGLDSLKDRMKSFETQWGDKLGVNGGPPANGAPSGGQHPANTPNMTSGVEHGSDTELAAWRGKYPKKSDAEIRAALQ